MSLQKVIIIEGLEPSIIGDSPLNFISLPHPKTKKSNQYLFHSSSLFEINAIKQEPSSWFIDNTIEHDGTLFLATPIDPIFLIIPYLIHLRAKTEKYAGKYVEISQIFTDPDYPDLTHLKNCSDLLSNIQLICDYQNSEEYSVIRLNDNKILSWIEKKVKRLSSGLEQEFREQKTNDSSYIPDFMVTALSIIADYLDSSIVPLLSQHFNVSQKKILKGETSELDQISEDTSQSTSQSAKKRPSSSQPKKNKKSKPDTTGIRPISSYFPKKQ